MNPKAALITGGAQRIGSSIAYFLAEKGWDIALHYNRSLIEANQLKEKIKKDFPNIQCRIYPVDLSSPKQRKGFISKVVKDFPHLALLINNASIFEAQQLSTCDYQKFKENFELHVFAPFELIRDFSQLTPKGHIINLLDAQLHRNRSSFAPYLLSKKSLKDLTLLAASELAPNHRVNAISPGIILPPPGQEKDTLDPLIQKTPLKRKGTIEEINLSLQHLIENEFLTGQIIYVDGGRHL